MEVIGHTTLPLGTNLISWSLTPLYQDMATQTRVRRLIGRRRAGLDRYIGVLSREVGSGQQDNIDPITELLTHLSGMLQVAWLHVIFLLLSLQVQTVGVVVGVGAGPVQEEVGEGSSASSHLISSSC
jgi:hypothetical protein